MSYAQIGSPKLNILFKPDVIPLANGDTAAPGIEAHLTQPQPAQLPGRFYSAADFHALYASGKVTPLDVVDALLPLIRRDVDSPTKYSTAWVQFHVDEVREAAKASTARWAAGKQLGVLDGVPIGVKDDIDMEGFVSTRGMKMDKNEPFFNTPAKETMAPVLRMQEAGAIVMGKLNQHEIGMGEFSLGRLTG
jgi:Asp-tRNA(Asn)/Glu-tRNA(Gln) amidotransferase A subunit family amidase